MIENNSLVVKILQDKLIQITVTNSNQNSLRNNEFFISEWIKAYSKQFLNKDLTIQIDDSIYNHQELFKAFQVMSFYVLKYEQTKVSIELYLNKNNANQDDIKHYQNMMQDFGFDFKFMLK